MSKIIMTINPFVIIGISLLLTLALLATIICAQCQIVGDVDHDDQVTSIDLNIIYKTINNHQSLSLVQYVQADADRNGIVNDNDLDLIFDIVLER